MPWFIEKREDQWCVVKGTRDTPLETEKCHATEAMAQAHMRALYASEPQARGLSEELQDVMDALQIKAAMKREADGEHPASHYLVVEDAEKPSTWHLRVRNVSGDPDHRLMGAAWAALHGGYRGNRYEGPGKQDAIAKLRRLYESEDMETPKMINEFSVYKENGTWRWRSISSTAVLDKEGEIVSEKAYDDAIAWGREHGFGELDLVHVKGTDVGDCDLSIRIGQALVEEGPWYDELMAVKARQAVQDDPDYWGVSIAFLPDPEQFDGVTYKGGIRIVKRTILPREMAAAHHTAIIAEGAGKMAELDEDRKEALKKLGQTEAEIAELAEKQKAVDPEEEKLVEKTQEPATILDRIKQLLGKTGDTPGETEADEPVAAEKTEEVEPRADEAPPEEQLKAFAETLIGQMVEKVAEAIAPLTEKIEVLEQKQGQYDEALAMIVKTKEDLVLERLNELPKTVKVAASETDAAKIDDQPDQAETTETYVSQIMATVEKSVKQVLGRATKKDVTDKL